VQWDLVCAKDSYVEITQTLFNVGVVIGFFAFTPFGDRYGRKKVLFTCHFFMDVFGIVLAFAPDLYTFCACQFLTGMCAAGVFLQGFVLACEIFPTSVKMIMAPLTSLFATFGMLSLVLIAYIFRNWRHLQLAISVAGLPMVVYAW
ncbi:Solute carrier family 22 member 6-A, partial [Lamellibrachia satsuma]